MGWGGKRAGAGRKRARVQIASLQEWIPDLKIHLSRMSLDSEALPNRAVLALRTYGASVTEIACVLSKREEDVTASFAAELSRGEAIAKCNLISRLVQRAMNGNSKALIELIRLLQVGRR